MSYDDDDDDDDDSKIDFKNSFTAQKSVKFPVCLKPI